MANRPFKNVKRFAESISKEIGQGGGGGTYPGAIQVDLLPSIGVNNTIYQLPNGDVYKCNVREEKHLHVGERYKFTTSMTKADYDAFWAKLPNDLELYQLENPERQESSDTDIIVYINFLRNVTTNYFETAPAVEFVGPSIGGGIGSLEEGSFVVDAQANVSYPTQKLTEDPIQYTNLWNAEYEAPISQYLSDAIASSGLGLTLDDFVPFFIVPTDTICTYEVVEQKSTIKSNALPAVGVPNTVFEVTPLATQIFESEDGTELPGDGTYNLVVFETAEEALAYMNKPLEEIKLNDIAWVPSDNKLFIYFPSPSAPIPTATEVPPYIQDGKVIKGVFALTIEDAKTHVQMTSIFSFVNRVISDEMAEMADIITIESLDKETIVLNSEASSEVQFVGFFKLGGEPEHFIYKDEFINLNDVSSIYPLMKIANGAKVKIDFGYESYNINNSDGITGFEYLEDHSDANAIACVGELSPYGFYLQKNEAQTQITATLFFGYSYQEISQTVVIYEGDVSAISNTSSILSSLPIVEFEVSGLDDGNFAVIRPRRSIVQD